MVGKRKETILALTALLAEGHVLLEDVPGVGKTMLVRAFLNPLMLITSEFNLHLIYCRQM